MVMMPNNSHDAVSRLIQLHARRAGIHLVWSGKTNEDMERVMVDLSNKILLSQSLWAGMKELWEMPEMSLLPEPIYAKICSIILKAQANFELKLAERNAGAAKQPPVTP